MDSASDDTFSALKGTETPYNYTNGVSPDTDTVTPTGETLRFAEIYPRLTSQALERLPRTDAVVNDKPRQPLSVLKHKHQDI